MTIWALLTLVLASCQLAAQSDLQNTTAAPALTARPNETPPHDTYLSIEVTGIAGALPVGESALQVTVRDGAGLAVVGAAVQARGDMTHPGMAPIFGVGVENEPGIYDVPLNFNMGGDWIITIDVTSANGLTASQQVSLQVQA